MNLLLGSKAKIKTDSPLENQKDVNYYTLSEIAQHDSATDLWMIIHGKVYDITGFIDAHPGGAEVLFECAGLDATEAFDEVGHSQYSVDMLAPLFKGMVRKDQLNAGNGSDKNESYLDEEAHDSILNKAKSKQKKKVENVSIGESNWKQRNKKKKKMKDHEVIWLLTLLAILAGFGYVYLERRKWDEFS